MRKKREEARASFAQMLPVERSRVMGRALREEEQQAGEELFSELAAAAARRDVTEVRALLAGYKYFLRYIGAESAESGALFALAQEM